MILIVDDEPSILGLLYDILTDEGFVVERAQNGKEALARALETPPDLVVTDLMMPIMDGRTLAQHLHHDETTAAIPILLLSATYALQADDLFTAVLHKPFDIGAFIDAIHELLV